MARLKNGWGLDGVLNLQDGQPFQLNYNFEGDYSGAGQGFDRPDVVGPIVYGKAPFTFLDLTAFSVPCTFDGLGTADTNCVAGTRHFGNLGRQLSARAGVQGSQLIPLQEHAADRAGDVTIPRRVL